MAATNYTPIQLYHSTTASAAPASGNLVNGELAINIADGKLYYKDSGGTVQIIASKGTGTIGGATTQVQYNSSGALAGSTNFTFDGTTATINTLNLTNALGAAYGGTAQSTYAQGDLLYASAANTLAKLGIGLNTYILTSNGSIPGWAAPSAISVNTATNLAGGAAGSVPYQSGAGATTFLSIGTANQVIESTGTAPSWVSTSGTGNVARVTSPTFVTPTLGAASATSINKVAITAPASSATLTIADGKTLTANASLTLTGTDSTTMTFPATSTTVAGLGITQTFTGINTFSPTARTSGAAPYFTVTTPADTGLTASTEVIGSSFTAATRTWATGALTLQRERVFAAPTYAFAGASTLTTAVNVDIGLPVAGTNATITNAYALRAADSLFTGPTIVDVNSASAALRITQVGAGNALLVEDSTNPDSTPFVVTAAGDVGIGTNNPGTKLHVASAGTTAIQVQNTASTGAAYLKSTNTATTCNFGVDSIGGYIETLGAYGTLFYTNGSERMRLDSSGNLGLGVTPSAWSASYKAITIGLAGGMQLAGNTSNTQALLTTNLVFTNTGATGWKLPSNVAGTYYEQYLGAHKWYYANANGVDGDATPIQAMTLDASGNLGLGATSPGGKLNVDFGNYVGVGARFQFNSSNVPFCINALNNAGDAYIAWNAAAKASSDTSTRVIAAAATKIEGGGGQFIFYNTTSSTAGSDISWSERARITSGGDFRVKGAGAAGSTDAFQISGSAPADAARLTSGGDLLVGTATAGAGIGFDVKLAVDAGSGETSVFKTSSSGAYPSRMWNSATTGDNTFSGFLTEGGNGTLRGNITYNRAGGLVAYNTTSDYRAKNIIGPVQNPGATIDALKVYEGVMKGATQSRPMLIAHEAQQHAPYAVSGVKDEVNEDGTPKLQQMDVSSLVPLLLVEIQSLRARVAQLEAK